MPWFFCLFLLKILQYYVKYSTIISDEKFWFLSSKNNINIGRQLPRRKIMNRLAKMIAQGDITVEELASAKELIERAEYVRRGVEACRETLSFPIGVKEIRCYSYMDVAGEYEAWGTCSLDGTFTCSCNWGGNHVVGTCNLLNFSEVFLALENQEFSHDLRRFLNQQIDKAGSK